MIANQKGFTLAELIISLGIMVLVSGGAGAAVIQILQNNDRNSDHMNAARQVENAGDWISRDTQMSLSVTTTNLTAPVFLNMSWTENVSSEDPIYHSANYSIEDVVNSVGTLMRRHTSTAGTDEETLVAQYVYYDVSDSDNTTQASYESPVLTVRITSRIGQILETREYIIRRRPNTFG